MCGVTGYIGNSTEPSLTYELITELFSESEARGVDASGVWATESGKNGCVFYHKEPIRSSEFVESPFWKRLEKHNINLLLAHARGATRGMGSPSCNKNNHPFVSQDCRIGLIHNGFIHEATTLKQRYQTLSECDSEILLRIYESMTLDRSDRLLGIKEIWSLVQQGHMAVAIGERHENNERSLCLFRNDKRPLWMADLREDLGQIFFFSSLEIWEEASDKCRSHILRKGHMLFELPVAQIWCLDLGKSLTHQLYEIDVKPSSKVWLPGSPKPILPSTTNLDVVTKLDWNDDVCNNYQKWTPKEMPSESENNDLEDLLESTKNTFADSVVDVYNLWAENSLTPSELDKIIYHYDNIKRSLEMISKITDRS